MIVFTSRARDGRVSPAALIFLILLVISIGVFFFVTLPAMREAQNDDTAGKPAEPVKEEPATPQPEVVANPVPPAPPVPDPVAQPEAPTTDDPEPVAPLEPNLVVQRLAEAIAKGDAEVIAQLLDNADLDPEALAPIKEALTSGRWTLVGGLPVVELGRTPKIMRWAVLLQDKNDEFTTDRLELDFTLNDGDDKGWSLARLRMASIEREAGSKRIEDRLALTEATGALDHARRFVDALLVQDIDTARKLVDSSRVSDAKLAGLCLIFEEGEFQLIADKPVVATVAKDEVSWFLVRMYSPTKDTESQFGLVLKKNEDLWAISEVNLDRLISFYAQEFGDGDRNYTPIVMNPQGGDSIVLYFAFDDSDLDERTKRQLRIVAQVLKADPNRKIRITGHTDAIGNEAYNVQLSAKRATIVRNALGEMGLKPEQIEIQAAGAEQPRRANFNEDGTDNPAGRRVNRRAEVYLDF